MKLSNFLLSIVAVFTLGAALSASVLVVSNQSTSVTYIPAAENSVGGGMTVELPPQPTSRQAQMLALAYEIAKKDGHEYPQLLQGIILQESKAGGMEKYRVAGQEFGLGPNERYYGVGQIKLAAARDVLKRHPDMWEEFDFHTSTDEEVIAKLINNDRFNITVASRYLLLLRQYGFRTPQELAIAYNRGPGGARNAGPSTEYSRAVMNHIHNIQNSQLATRRSNRG